MLFIIKSLGDFFSAVPNIALALSVVFNVFLIFGIKKLYSDQKEIYDSQTEMLKNLIPYVMGKK